MSKLIIHKAGLFTSIQDQGRFGFEGYAVPVSGAMDKRSARLANLLLGNDANEAVFEITLLGPTIEFTEPTQFCITGANLSPKLNETLLEKNKVYRASAHDILSFGQAVEGCRAYLAIGGSICVPTVMSSKSTYTYGAFGGYEGRTLQKGDIITIDTVIREERAYFEYLTDKPINQTIRLFKGPEFDHFSEEDKNNFINTPYVLSSTSNRMGLRLDGPPLDSTKDTSIISSPLISGTIQVPPSGLPIIAMYDSGTMGGYPRIAVVYEEDLDILAQLKPHDSLIFSWY